MSRVVSHAEPPDSPPPAVAVLAQDVPGVAELDLNPLIFPATGSSLVDVKARRQRVTSEPDAPRRLRPRGREGSAARGRPTTTARRTR